MEKEEGNESDTTPRVETTIETWKRLEAIDDGKIEEEKVDLEKARNLFRSADIITGASTPVQLYVPELDGKIMYCRLTYKELTELTEITDIAERNVLQLYKHLNKADPEVTEEKIRNLPGSWVNLMLLKIAANENRFLLRPEMKE